MTAVIVEEVTIWSILRNSNGFHYRHEVVADVVRDWRDGDQNEVCK